MPIKINLLKNRHTISEADYQREGLYYQYAVITAVLAVVVTVAFSIWQFILTRTYSELEIRIGKSTQELVGLSEANAKQIYLKSRLNLITAFLDDRSIARSALQRIFSLSIPGVSVSAARFDSDETLTIQAIADDALTFESLIDYLEKDSGFFLQTVSKGVNRQKDGKYQMNVSLTIPKG